MAARVALAIDAPDDALDMIAHMGPGPGDIIAGWALKAKGDQEEALARITQSDRCNNEEGARLRAAILRSQGHTEQALAESSELLTTHDAAWAHEIHAENLEAAGRWTGAWREWELVKEADPGVRPWSRLAFALVREGREAQGYAEALECCVAFEKHPQAWKTLGAVKEAQGDSAGAIAAYAVTRELGGLDVDTALRLAALLVSEGDRREAQATVRAFADDIPAHDDRQAAIRAVLGADSGDAAGGFIAGLL